MTIMKDGVVKKYDDIPSWRMVLLRSMTTFRDKQMVCMMVLLRSMMTFRDKQMVCNGSDADKSDCWSPWRDTMLDGEKGLVDVIHPFAFIESSLEILLQNVMW